MEIDLSKVITYTFSGSAILISLIAIIISKQNLKKQLRLGKLEEMLEILFFLNGYYNSLLRIFVGFENSIKSLQNSNEITDEMKETIKYRKKFVDVIDRETITNKISRLKVLSNAYLSNSKHKNDLKIRIHTISSLFYDMYMFIYMEGNPSIIIQTNDLIIPHPKKMENYINKIENDLIIEMNLGFKSIVKGEQDNYYRTSFKNDLDS